MHRTIVVGSPRPDGRSAALADEIFNACMEECPDDGVSIVSMSGVEIDGCIGCDACKDAGEAYAEIEEGDPLEPSEAVVRSDAAFHSCIIDDDMAEVRKHLDAADELIVVSPVYFSGAPSRFKAFLDRLQPYYRSDLRRLPKRPLAIHVVGEGDSPYGYDALIDEVRSACGVAGFALESLTDWVGCIAEDGEILADPERFDIDVADATDDADVPFSDDPRESAKPSSENPRRPSRTDPSGRKSHEDKGGYTPTGSRAKLSLGEVRKGRENGASAQKAYDQKASVRKAHAQKRSDVGGPKAEASRHPAKARRGKGGTAHSRTGGSATRNGGGRGKR